MPVYPHAWLMFGFCRLLVMTSALVNGLATACTPTAAATTPSAVKPRYRRWNEYPFAEYRPRGCRTTAIPETIFRTAQAAVTRLDWKETPSFQRVEEQAL